MVSTLAEILDRLTGVALVQARVEELARSTEKALDWLQEVDRRLTRIETLLERDD